MKITIDIDVCGKTTLDSEDPNLCCYLHKQRCTFDQFLTNPKRMMEYILAAGAIDWEMYFSDGDGVEVRK